MILRTAIDSLAAVLFSAPCRICCARLLTASRIPICTACLAWFEPIERPMCVPCGRPFSIAPAAESIQPICRFCRDEDYAFHLACSYGVYNDALHQAILPLKYEEVTRLGAIVSPRGLRNLLREPGEFRVDVVVPVPQHPDRQRERGGYSQAELIARPLVRRWHLKQGAYPLVRTKPRPARLVLSRKEHWDSVRGAYATRKGLWVDKLRVLLVDDVMTTGATLDSCAR